LAVGSCRLSDTGRIIYRAVIAKGKDDQWFKLGGDGEEVSQENNAGGNVATHVDPLIADGLGVLALIGIVVSS